ncbi:hypothetical protein [Yersinia pseudotuberculosis]|uniref:hypothetical protein n=1 Tax=Yersinia pseudotuberculosis TaxID=633 RepID=UPI0005E64004|nr:hypothetical protein [Yersinia pseudotuberculosis]CND26665.1 Uncharacterised protein [Yersinia pseudotuberculosis]
MTNKLEILATTVNCYTENDVLIIGFGNDAVSPDNYIIISRFDDGDIDDSIGIQTHLSEMEVSNAIKAIGLNENECVIEIKDTREKQVGFAVVVIKFKGASADYKSLVRYVNAVFSGSSIKVQVS